MPKPYFNNHTDKIAEIIRVDHAGEFGAQRIYQGQLSWISSVNDQKIIREMLEQELEHLDFFNAEIANKNIRPTIFLPLWDKIGYLAGAISAIAGVKYAMLLTEAVEEVIIEHYQNQIEYLTKYEPSSLLLERIKQFKQDEAQHMDIAIDNESKKTAMYGLLSKLIRFLCKTSITISKKV